MDALRYDRHSGAQQLQREAVRAWRTRGQVPRCVDRHRNALAFVLDAESAHWQSFEISASQLLDHGNI